MKIGLLSDTHGYLDPKIFEHFKACDEIWHAGDIGDASVCDAIENFKPLRAVYGNIDDKILQSRYPEDLRFNIEGMSVWMTHIGGTPPNYNPRVKKVLKDGIPGVFICGHSHILRVKKDPKLNMLYVNPGAAGNHGFHSMRTIIRMELRDARVEKMEVIELGKGALGIRHWALAHQVLPVCLSLSCVGGLGEKRPSTQNLAPRTFKTKMPTGSPIGTFTN